MNGRPDHHDGATDQPDPRVDYDPAELLGWDPEEELDRADLTAAVQGAMDDQRPIVDQIGEAIGEAYDRRSAELYARQRRELLIWAQGHPADPRAVQILRDEAESRRSGPGVPGEPGDGDRHGGQG